jgi:hypothetical protein
MSPGRIFPLVTTAVIASFALMAVASAQTPGTTPVATPDRPNEPPPEAINCVRPDSQKIDPSLKIADGFSAAVDDALKTAVLTIPAPPPGITCFSIFRDPSGSNPISFAWDTLEVTVPPRISDEVPFLSSGQHCYYLYFGSPAGITAPSESCLEIPTTFAPEAPPQPPQDFKPPPAAVEPPSAGTGLQDRSGSYRLSFAGALLAAGVLGAAGVFIRRRHSS